MSDILSMAITVEPGDRFGWECECGMKGGPWSYWETAEMVVLSHRNRTHIGKGKISGYELRPPKAMKNV